MAELDSQQWLQRLIVELGKRQARYELLDRYHRSDAPLPPNQDKGKAKKAWDYIRKKSRVNWAEMIVEALIERMQVVGFRTGDGPTDDLAWKIWQRNDLDTASVMLHRTKGIFGEAYTIVGEMDDRLKVPRVTCEDPRQMIGAADPVDRRTLLAALKLFHDDIEGVDRAYVYTPGQVHRATRVRKSGSKVMSYTYSVGEWKWDEPEDLSTDRMPVVWFPNRQDLAGRTMGEFEHLLDDMDRINLLVLQRVAIAILQAFRQRAVKGDLPEKDEYGNVIDYNVLLASDPAALWKLPAGVEMWESAGVDLTPILESVKADVRELAGRGRTPLYYLYPNEGGSAEGANTQREALFFRATSRCTESSGPWETTMALSLEVLATVGEEGDDSASGNNGALETLWMPPDRVTATERYAAATQAKSAGVPWRTVMSEVLQYSPQAVERMEQERALEAGEAADATAREQAAQ